MRYNIPIWNTETHKYMVSDLPNDFPEYPWVEVPERPNYFYTFDLELDEWVFDRELWLDGEIRPTRNELLTETDFYLLVDRYEQLTNQEQLEIKTYRQNLRDFTAVADINNLVWPTKPEWA
jgi:hypothetical protein